MTCDLAAQPAQIRSRNSASPSLSRIISKPSLKSSLRRQILGLESVSSPSQDSNTTALTITDMFSVPLNFLMSKTFAGIYSGGFCARSRKYI